MRESDEDRFAEFVRAHSASLFRTAYLSTGDHQRAEDLLQTTLVRVYQRWSRVQEMDLPVAYARKVLVSQSVSWWRKRSSHESPLLDLAEPSWGGPIDEIAESQRVWAAVLTLPPKAASSDGAAVLPGPVGGRNSRDLGRVAGDREEHCARGQQTSGRAARGDRVRSRGSRPRRRRHESGPATGPRRPPGCGASGGARGGPRGGARRCSCPDPAPEPVHGRCRAGAGRGGRHRRGDRGGTPSGRCRPTRRSHRPGATRARSGTTTRACTTATRSTTPRRPLLGRQP